jgi:hypothetical protein
MREGYELSAPAKAAPFQKHKDVKPRPFKAQPSKAVTRSKHQDLKLRLSKTLFASAIVPAKFKERNHDQR